MKRVAEQMNVHKIRYDLRRESTMGVKLSLYDDAAMVPDWESKPIYSGEKLKDELCSGCAWKKGAGKMVVQLLLKGMKPARCMYGHHI